MELSSTSSPVQDIGAIVSEFQSAKIGVKGKSNCPAQFGRKPGIVSEPATGFIFANLVPKGNPSDSRYVHSIGIFIFLLDLSAVTATVEGGALYTLGRSGQ